MNQQTALSHGKLNKHGLDRDPSLHISEKSNQNITLQVRSKTSVGINTVLLSKGYGVKVPKYEVLY